MADPVNSYAAVRLTNDDTWVYTHKDGELIHKARTCGEEVYTTAEVNLRNEPNLAGDIVTVIPEDVKLLRVGKHAEWSVIQIDGANYYIATDYISRTNPSEVTEWIFQTEGKEVSTETVETAEIASETLTGAYLGEWTITFYCNCVECNGQWAGGATASGTTPTEGRTVACGSLDFGTKIYIDCLGEYIVEDRGVNGNWIDVYLTDHDRCNQMGMLSRGVWIK